MKTKRGITVKKTFILLLAMLLVLSNIPAGTVVYAAEDLAQETAVEEAAVTSGEEADDTEEPADDDAGTGDTGTTGDEDTGEHTGDETTPGDEGTGTEEDIPAPEPGTNPVADPIEGTEPGADTGDILPADGEDLTNAEDTEDITDEELLVIEEEEPETESTAALGAKVEKSGVIYASDLNEYDELVLTGETILNVDVERALSAIRGKHKLTIRGNEALFIQSGGHGIDVRDFCLDMSGGDVTIHSDKDGLHVANSIDIKGGELRITSLERGICAIYSQNGPFTMSGGFVRLRTGSGSNAMRLVKGNVEVSGGTLRAEGTDNGIFAENGAMTLNGDIEAVGFNAIWAKSGLQITGGKTYANGAMAICTQGQLVIKNADVIAIDDYGIYAGIGMNGVTGIEIDNSDVRAKTTAKVGNALYSLKGNINITGNSNVTASGTESGIFAENGAIKLNGKITVSGDKNGILAKNNIVIESGSIMVQGSGSAAVYSNSGTVLVHAPLAIISPEGGKVSGKTIVGTDGQTAKDVVIKIQKLPGSVSIANGDEAEVGDVLTLNFSSDFPFRGRSFQWEKREKNAVAWKIIPGATTASYPVKTADQGYIFRVEVSVSGYSGEKNSTECMIRVKNNLDGSVSYDRPATVGVEMTAAATLTSAGIPVNATHYQWQVSNDGASGWTNIGGATSATYTPAFVYLGQYIRVVVSANGYTGTVLGAARKVAKQANSSIPVRPQLQVNPSSYATVTVTNARADQEYVLMSAGEDEDPSPNWESARCPSANGTLSLSAEKDRHVVVFTRMRETDTQNAGKKVSSTRVFNGDVPDLQGITLSIKEMNGSKEEDVDQDELRRYYAMEGKVYKITVHPVPENAAFDGVQGGFWKINDGSVYGTYYTSQACTTPLNTSTSYKTVYYKPTDQRNANAVKLSAKSGTLRDSISLVQGNIADGYIVNLIVEPEEVIIRQGERQSGYSYQVVPGKATPGMTATLQAESSSSGTPPAITFDAANHTFAVDATYASGGTYTFLFKVSSGSGSASASASITVEPGKGVVTLNPGNGTGTGQTKEVKKGTEYVLPEPADVGFSHAAFGWVFDGWDVEGERKEAGEGIIINDNITITARWKEHEHDLVFVPGFDPTCIWTGNVEYYRCTICYKPFSDAQGHTEITTGTVISATGHTPSIVTRENEVEGDDDTDGSYDEVTYCAVCHAETNRTHVILERRILEKVAIAATTQNGSFGPYLANGSVTLNWRNGLTVDSSRFSVSDWNQPYQDELSGEAVTDWAGDSCYVTYTVSNNTDGDRSLIFSKLEESKCALTVSGYDTECRSVTSYLSAGRSCLDIVFRLTKKKQYAVKGPEKVEFGAELQEDGSYTPPAGKDVFLENIGTESLEFLSIESAVLTGGDKDCFKLVQSIPYPVTIAAGDLGYAVTVEKKTD